MSSTRSAVLQVFKKLHRASHTVFRNDTSALNAARMKINEEFRKNRECSDSSKIQEMLKLAEEVEVELRTGVVQAKIVE
ncbi:complex III assembly factor LYRM7 [Phlebotomus argentipes]|uniref:complex III assembly factor LYRM7 n=1 Tax=Phlebotomus argentipes TaxID=94469 RepID=UPI0028936619|nr:complex III assembly factor LYRM7 [Phlebotomus argentipes]